MSGQSLQTCKPIKDTLSIINHVLGDEETKSKGVGMGSRKVGELAEILGGEARTPRWIGKGWNGEPGDGLDPTDAAGVAREFGKDARKQTCVFAYSCIMHVPKGLSLVVVSDPELRDWFATVRPLMTKAYMEALESRTEIRVGKNGSGGGVPVKGLKGYWVGHSISAGGDPHLHNHLIVSATAETIDGRRGQIDGKKLMAKDARIADGSARRVLMEEAAKVGLGFGLDGELLGISRELIERASTGRNAIQAIQTHYAAEGTPISDEQAWHHYRQVCEGKADKGLSQSLIASIRAARGEELGAEALEHSLDAALDNEEKAKLVGYWLAAKYGISARAWESLASRARAAALAEPQYDDVTRVVALMATLGYAPEPEDVAGLCVRFADLADLAGLMDAVAADPRVLVGQKHWVLRAQLEREEVVASRATRLLAGGAADATIGELLADTDGAALVVISGVAGGGKSSALAEAKAKWSARGVTVWATARNHLTATETGNAAGAQKRDSLSTAALRKMIALGGGPRAGDVLVVDECGLLDSADQAMILALAESGVRVKELGDSHQIQPIDGSTDARIVMDLAKAHGMPSLKESFRTAAWKDLHDLLRGVAVGDGDPDEVLGRLDIRVATNAEEAAEIAQSFAGAEIAVQSNDLRCQVAEALARPKMRVSRFTGKPVIAMLRDGIAGWAGDQVVVRKNIKGKNPQGEFEMLANGEKGRIIDIVEKFVVINLGDKNITISREVAREALALGGVQTGDSAQGQTWNRAVVVLSGMETREWLYSAATRGRQAPIFVALADSGEAGALLISQVLAREGIAQTVAEMASTDRVLAESVRRSTSGDTGGAMGGSKDLQDDIVAEAEKVVSRGSREIADEALRAAEASEEQFGRQSRREGLGEPVEATAPEAVDSGESTKDAVAREVDPLEPDLDKEKTHAQPAKVSPFAPFFPDMEVEGTVEIAKKHRPGLILGNWDDAPSAEPAGPLDDTSSAVGDAESAIAPEVVSDGAAEIASAGESVEAEIPKVAAREPLGTRVKNFPGRREYQCGFYYKNGDGVWSVDEKKRQALVGEVLDRLGPLGHISDERWQGFFNITRPKQLGPNDWYTPSEALLAKVERDKAEAEQRARGTYRPSGGTGSAEGTSQGHSGGYGYGRR